MSANINVSEIEEQAVESAESTRRKVRRLTLTAVGFAAMAYDAGRSVCHGAGEYLHKAEKRGEEVQAALNARADRVQQQVTEEAKAQRAKVIGAVNAVTDSVGETGKSIEDQFKSKLSSLKIGSGTVIETDEIKIEVEVIDKEPFDGYDSLNAQEVVNSLNDMERDQLQRVYDYEAKSKNRVTVLREVELLLAADEEETGATDASDASEELES